MKTLIFAILIFTSTNFLCGGALFSDSLIVASLQKSISLDLIQMQAQGESEVHPVSDQWIVFSRIPLRTKDGKSFQQAPFDPEDARNTKYFTLFETNTENEISIDKASFKRRVMYAPLPKRDNDLRIAERIFIHLDEKLQEGKQYTLKVDEDFTGYPIKVSFVYNPENSLSKLIHIDSYGFRADDRKAAFLGMFAGSFGDIDVDSTFSVIDLKDGKKVYDSTAVKEPYEGWPKLFVNKPYSNVYEMDFSELRTPGEYIIKHSSGYSVPFVISVDPYRVTLNTLALGMYHQRRDALSPEITRFTHKAMVSDKIYVYKSDKLDNFIIKLLDKLPEENRKIKYLTQMEGDKVAFESQGHMDAGDYSPYTYNSALLVFAFLNTLDLYREKVYHDNLGLPESGDSIPDLFQEMLIELNWLKGMQDPHDGGVFSMIKALGCSYESTMPGDDPNQSYYLAPKDTIYTAVYAAALARAARSPTLHKFRPDLIEDLKGKAEKAWKFLEENEGYFGFHHYGRENEDIDDRAWAAVELYALTGDKKYHDVLLKLHKPIERYKGLDWMNHSFGNVNRTLALWKATEVKYEVDKDLMKKSSGRFHDYLDFCVKNARNMPYGLVFDNVYKRFYTLGWFFPVSAYSLDLLFGYELYKERKYMDVAIDQIHYTLGANPLDKSFITGLGYNRLHDIVDQKSLYDKIEEPISGMPVSPVVTGYTFSPIYGYEEQSLTYPISKPNTSESNWQEKDWTVYGILELPYDGWNVKGEMTIEKLGAMICALATVTPVTDKQYKRPEFTLTLSFEGKEIKPKIVFKEKKPENYRIMWFLNGIPISADPDYSFNIKDISRKDVIGVEIITSEGMRYYSESTYPIS